jgi:hypothetical protein
MKGRPSSAQAASGNLKPAKPAVSVATEARANAFLDREALLDHAINAGVIGANMRAHYAACFDADPEGTRSYLGAVGATRAAAVSGASDAYNDSALGPQERERIAAAREGKPPRIGGEGL